MAGKSIGKTCKCGKALYNDNMTGMCRPCRDVYARTSGETTTGKDAIAADTKKRAERDQIAFYKSRYDDALNVIEDYERQLGVIDALKAVNPIGITPKQPRGTSEATPVIVASDWHTEEIVGAEVGGLNTFSLEIARERAVRFWQSSLRLIRLLNQDVTITDVVIALLGDFITNQIHEAQNAETNELQPVHAILYAQDLIMGGINFLLENSDYRFTIVCHSGNHARTSKKTRFSAENGHSLEYLMYRHLAAYYKDEPRIAFVVSPSYHTYLPIYDQTIRFHHGHAIRYQGGVGGLYIPVNKAIAQWNKGRHADLDVFGHFHQLRDGGNFICNGSLIGHNGFAISIKADYEEPRQALFLMDKRRGRTCTWPILVQPKVAA